ncbi:5'-AMP-activated protein kinase catalytic subunit alpha-1-like [Lissotriton helveticus]
MEIISNTLGEGCCGKARQGSYLGRRAAIKSVPYDIMSEADIRRECRVYEALNHKNVVKLLGPPERGSDGWLIPLEFIDGCILEDLIFPAGKLSTAEKDRIIFGMCNGLRYLHSQCIVHQDLKPNNIMVRRSKKEAVIIDLGLAKFVNYTESGNPYSTGVNKGFKEYAAPEARDGYIRTRASDVWSMGKVIAEVLLGYRLDWDDCSRKNIKSLLRGSKYAPIVSRMLKTDPNIRFTMDDVVDDLRTGPALGRGDRCHCTRCQARSAPFVVIHQHHSHCPHACRVHLEQNVVFFFVD